MDRLHNTAPEQRATDHLNAILLGGTAIIENWVGYGAALNEMRSKHGGNDKAFGKAVSAAGLDKWPEGYSANLAEYAIHDRTRTAAMWAAALTSDELNTHMSANPKVAITARGGFRGLHAALIRASKTKAVEDNAPEEVEEEQDGPEIDGDPEAVTEKVKARLLDALSDFETEPGVGGGIYVTISGAEYYISISEIGENGNTVWR